MVLRRVAIILGAAVLLFASYVVGITVMAFTESSAFCTSCHAAMEPEAVTHRISPHAGLECGDCHVGPGTWSKIRAHIVNVRYVWEYPLDNYTKPIPLPIKSLPATEKICTSCHLLSAFAPVRLRLIDEYASDEANTLRRVQLTMRTAAQLAAPGFGRGSHWHVANPVYYIPGDESVQTIPWVRVERLDTAAVEYQAADSALTPEQVQSSEQRRMDCIDCHNRVQHREAPPDEAMNRAMASGLVPADLPQIKQLGMDALSQRYATDSEAATDIRAIADFYASEYPDLFEQRQPDVEAAVTAIQVLYQQSHFPFMGVYWDTYPDNVGHQYWPGCFRCHDGNHFTADNRAIPANCNSCHSVPQISAPGQGLPAFQTVSLTAPPDSHANPLWVSEHRFRFNVDCAACHTVSNAGGADDASFCANSACHGRDWQFLALDAPRVLELTRPERVPAVEPRPIPHPIEEGLDCRRCHDLGKVVPFRPEDAEFANDRCTECHQPPAPAEVVTPPPAAPVAAVAPPNIPHTLEERENCLQCHAVTATLSPAPQDHANYTNSVCQACHKLE